MLFLDRGSPHRAKRSRQLAHRLGIEFRFLPTACPELNPMEGIWREVKGKVLANEPAPDIDRPIEKACERILKMSLRQRLRNAGVLYETSWLTT